MVTIRPATADDAEALGLITVSASLGTFIGRIPDDRLDFGWQPADSAAGWRTTLEALPVDQFFLVAEVERQVGGFVWAGPATDASDAEGEIKGLYVLPTKQRQGIGRLLVQRAVAQLGREHAIASLLIGCVVENPSCDFYRHLGGVEAFRRPALVDQHETEEIVFRWTDLAPFA